MPVYVIDPSPAIWMTEPIPGLGVALVWTP